LSVVGRPAFKAAAVVLIVALASAWLLHMVERDVTKADHPYNTYLGTIQQVGILLFSGYDAEKPARPIGYVLTMFCTFLGIGLLALITADLASVLVSMAMAGAGRRRIRTRRHIIITGWHHTTQVLVEQLTHREDGPQREVVVVDGNVPRLPLYDPDVHLLRGDPTEEEVLRRAALEKADTAIVPIDWSLPETLQDARTTLSVMAIKSIHPDLYTCAEILKPQNRRHVERSGVDEAICVGELSQRLLGQAVVTHGVAGLLEKLLTFSAESEIYRVALPDKLAGQTFRWLLRRLNKEKQAILLAVQRGGETHANPRGTFVLEKGDMLFILAAAYAEDLAEIDPGPPPAR
jgi:voltage-gated potassium channel